MGATFSLGTTNVKIDLVNGNTIQASVSATLTELAQSYAAGNQRDQRHRQWAGQVIKGNSGANILGGRGGNDTVDGKAGGDTYIWHSGDGSDTINDTSISLSETDVLS